MHPREGRSEGEPRLPALSRRGFIRGAAGTGLLAAGLGPLLEACSTATTTGGTTGTGTTTGVKTIGLPRPDSPVTWPIYLGNHAIASGMEPERNATLQLFNWTAYVNQQCLKDFEKKYNCKIQLTTFNTMSEAMSKLRSGQVNFDVFMGVTVDQMGPLVEGKLVQPLNHSYLPNIAQAWPDFTNPFYDGKWQYTVPYTIYTTGIAWRTDKVPENPYTMANPWAMPWQPKYKGKVAILDDYREGISLGLMKNGIFDLNTTSAAQIKRSQQTLQQLSQMVNVHIDNNDYSNLPSGQIWIHHAWSGDIAGAPSYLPKGVSPRVLGYWFPPDGKGPVGNDTLTVLAGAQNPVLAHLWLNYLLDVPNALTNISYNGYMQPLTAITPQRLVKEKLLPPNLTSTAVLPSYFRRGVMELQLPAEADALWQQAWLTVSKGI
jgi:spermidine/putrescine transport system substrate-binding protein